MHDTIDNVRSTAAWTRAGLAEFKARSDVQAWVDAHGGGETGEGALREAMARAGSSHPPSSLMAEEWLHQQDRARYLREAAEAQENARRAVAAAERSAAASERAARYAMWSAVISAAVGIVSAAAYWLTRTTT